jgi:hypothetical protein
LITANYTSFPSLVGETSAGPAGVGALTIFIIFIFKNSQALFNVRWMCLSGGGFLRNDRNFQSGPLLFFLRV